MLLFTNVNLQVVPLFWMPLCTSNCLINISAKTSNTTLNLSHPKPELLTSASPMLLFQGLPSHFWKVCPSIGSGYCQGHSLENHVTCALKYENLTTSHHLHGATQLQFTITSDPDQPRTSWSPCFLSAPPLAIAYSPHSTQSGPI